MVEIVTHNRWWKNTYQINGLDGFFSVRAKKKESSRPRIDQWNVSFDYGSIFFIMDKIGKWQYSWGMSDDNDDFSTKLYKVFTIYAPHAHP